MMQRAIVEATGLLALAGLLPAQDPQSGPPVERRSGDLASLSLEELMNVPVEVAGRHEESLHRAAASVFVLTEAEIRRSGLRAVPELLRLVPGMLIAQDVPGAYSFSSRTGEFQFSGMLVLIDGQRLYPTLLRREYWQAIDLPIENIERIEVIRGPGGARWGDQASQGVINIVTKKAADAAGVVLVGSAGTEERWTTSFRQGASLGDHAGYYVYGKLANRDGGYPDTPGDRWSSNRLGARFDFDPSPQLHIAVDGELHASLVGDSYLIDPGFTENNDISGGRLKTRIGYTHDSGDTTELKLAFDAYDQDDLYIRNGAFDDLLRFREQMFDGGLQHMFALAPDHRLFVGAGLRTLAITHEWNSGANNYRANELRLDGHVAWEWDLATCLRLTLGGNVGYVEGRLQQGADVQPDIRLAFLPDDELTLWAAFSSNEEPNEKFLDASGALVTRPTSRFRAFELGARKRWGESLLLQADTFVYDIDHQVNDEQTDPSGHVTYTADGATRAFGGELSAQWRAAEHVHLGGFYATSQIDVHGFDPTGFNSDREVPRNRAGLTAGVELPGNVDLDGLLLYTERHWTLPTYWRADLRLCWRASEHASIELVGQNLLDPQHPEYIYLEQAQRGAFLLVELRF